MPKTLDPSDPRLLTAEFERSTHGDPDSDQYVEVARIRDGNQVSLVLVRDPKKPHVVLQFTPAEWDAFIAGAKDGEFDL